MTSTTTETPYQVIANKEPNIIIVATATLLSLLGSFLIMFTYIRFKDLRTVSRHVVVCIAISDLMSSLSSCAGLSISPKLDLQNVRCVIQAFFGATFILSSFLWTMFLAITLYVVIVKQNTDLAERLIFPWFHFIGWCLPLAINVIAVSLNKLGNTGDFETAGWCWIYVHGKNDKDGILWMLIDGKGIELLTYIVIPALYIVIKIRLRSKSIGDNTLGAVNCILFCFLTPKVRHRLKDLFWRCHGASRCRKNVQLMESDDDDEDSFR